ncbi:MAG: LysR family transcriptional regulator [Betaproteobacteria bacterium]|nr:LysR family transcriptional regulator [Betaproteobacteria bacterium]
MEEDTGVRAALRRRSIADLLKVLEVVRHRSLNKAASALGVSQPALSKSIHRLETLLGVQLFERTPLGVVPTAQCQMMITHLQAIDAEVQIVFSRGARSGKIAIGCSPLAAETVVARALGLLLAARPATQIVVREGRRAALTADLRGGQLDLVVAPMTNDDISPDLVEEELFYDEMRIVVRAEHPLASRKTLRLRDLLDYRWLIPPEGTFVRRQIDREFQNARLGLPRIIDAINSTPVIKHLVQSQDCLAVLSAKSAYQELKEGRLVALDGAWKFIPRPFAVIRRVSAPRSSAIHLLIRFLKKVASEMEGPLARGERLAVPGSSRSTR